MSARQGPARSVVPLLLVLGAALAGQRQAWGSVPVAKPAVADTEPVIVDLRIGRLSSATVEAYRVRTEVLLPMTRFLQLAEALFRLSPEGRLESEVYAKDGNLVIDVALDTMRLGAHRVRLEPEFRLLRDGELYVGSERLGDLLGRPFIVDWTELAVTLLDPVDLPIARRLRREAEREAFIRRAERVRPELQLGLERPKWDGLVFDYSVLSPSGAPLDGSSYAVALGADAFGGALELGVASVGPAGEGRADVEGAWTGVWRDRPWLTQLRLGDGPSTGPQPRDMRGLLITNAPFLRPSLLGTARFDGVLEPGWSVDAYVGGALVAYDSADAAGRFAFDLPVRYGENPVDFVAYGPFGEVREFNRTYRVINELLPAGQLEYGISGGTCGLGPCVATANLDLRYGVSRRWTLRAGFDQFWRDTLPDLQHAYLSVIANPTTAWAFEAEGVTRGLARGAARYEPSLNLRVGVEYARYARRTPAPLLTPAGRLSDWTVSALVRPIPASGMFFFDGALQRMRTTLGVTTAGRIGASLQVQETRLLPFVRVLRDEPAGVPGTTQSFVGLNAFVLPRPALGPLLGQVWLRTTTEFEAAPGRWAAASVSAARQVGRGHRVELGVGWQRGGRGPTYSLLLSSYLPLARSTMTVTAPAGGPVTAVEFLQGSVLWDRATGRLAGAPGPSLERAGLAGRVFLDENGNDVPDPGEPGLPNVRIIVGASTAVSDSAGRYRIWDIVPFEPVLVTVDSLSLESPLLVPGFAAASVVPGPNRFRVLDVPIVQAGVVEGRVSREGRGVAGITLVLTDRRTRSRRSVVSFSDGAFYILGVKPGDYELTVDPRVLEALGVAADPVRFDLRPGAAGVGLTGLDVRLTPRR